MKNNTTLNKLIKERPSQLVLDIREAIIEEYNEHETCGYDIGCIVTSKTLTDKLDKILSQSIKAGYELAIKDVLVELKPLILSKENLKVGQDTINLDFNDGVKNCINVIENTYQSLLKGKL
jgi:hypothetical protein